ncbi:MAG TPA: hypothetical protein DEB39_02400 [Planctomycetaceae bacterium]|nr:hypothetical protein [Planctomycetaceae bacterium]
MTIKSFFVFTLCRFAAFCQHRQRQASLFHGRRTRIRQAPGGGTNTVFPDWTCTISLTHNHLRKHKDGNNIFGYDTMTSNEEIDSQ